MNDPLLIAIDIGGTSFRVALADADVRIQRRNAELTRAAEGPEQGIARIIETVRRTAGEYLDQVQGISVAAAGPIDPQTGVILTPPSLPTWHHVPLKARLEAAFGIPVWVENDADLAAVGEWRFGAGRGYDRVVYMTVSTGIGGGIVLDGEMLRGSKVSAAELGHIVVVPDGPVCNCGGKGHVEAVASGTAIARMARQRISPGAPTAILEQCGGDAAKVTAAQVVDAARNGDALAVDVLAEAGSYIGMAIASIVHILDPDVVVIGGGVSNAGELLLEPVRKSFAERAMADFRNRPNIVRSELGDDSGLIGAAVFGLAELARSRQ